MFMKKYDTQITLGVWAHMLRLRERGVGGLVIRGWGIFSLLILCLMDMELTLGSPLE